MEMQVIKNKTTVELQHDEETLRAQLFALRIQKSLGKLEAPHSISNIRKDIARIKTELSRRMLNGEQIKPLHINKMVLPEDKKTEKKEPKKIKSTAKDKKVITKATDVVTIPEITKTVDKTNAKKAKNKKEVVKKDLALIKKPIAKVKQENKKSTVKTTSDPTVEKTTESKEEKA